MIDGLNTVVKQVEVLTWTLDTANLTPISDKFGNGEWFDTFEIPENIKRIFSQHDFIITWNHNTGTANIWNAVQPKPVLRRNPETLRFEEVLVEDVPAFTMRQGDTFQFGGTIKHSLVTA